MKRNMIDEKKYDVLQALSDVQKQYGDDFELSVTNRDFQTLYN